MATFDYDVVIIGSGFGGSVAALRAAEKGYRVGVMESGRRWSDEDIPKSQWHLPDFLWFPAAELYGIQRVEYLDDVLVLSGAGVGGGSHVYANTLYVPPKQFFDAPEWSSITDWADELAPHIDQATRMLGVVRYPYMPTDVDRVMQSVAVEMGRGETFNKAPVGVYFGSPGVEADDPYFGGVGPRRTGCISCGKCNIGCGHNAKNKLTTNYLYLAEKLGVEIHELHEVYDLVPLDGGGFEVHARHPGWAQRAAHLDHHTYTAEQVIVAAHAYGSAKLLLHMQHEDRLTGLSSRARETGPHEFRTAARHHTDTRRVEARSRTDPPHPGFGFDHVRRLARPADEHRACLLGRRKRPVRVSRHVPRTRRAGAPDGRLDQGARRTPDGSAEFRRPPSLVRADGHHALLADDRHVDRALLARTTGCGAGTPAHLPPFTFPSSRSSSTAWRRRWAAERVHCRSRSSIAPPRPTSRAEYRLATAAKPARSTRISVSFGQPGLHVIDGSVMPANTGVNPSLMITALAERAMSLWPNKGDADTRPPLGSGYQRVRPVPPHRPVVPAGAPGELRLDAKKADVIPDYPY